MAERGTKERAAKKACLNGDASKGVELLTDLYVDTNDPTYIFNQGRCYEQNNRCEDAIVRFREYLRKTAGGNEKDQTDAQKHITDCEALLAKKSAESAPPPTAPAVSAQPPSIPTAPPQPVPTLADAVPPAAVVVAPPDAGTRAGAGTRAAGVAIMAAGGGALIAGIIFNVKHNSMVTDLKSDYSGDTADSAQTYKTLSMVGYGVGAACLMGGAALYWLGSRAGKTAVVPTAVAGNPGILVSGGF